MPYPKSVAAFHENRPVTCVMEEIRYYRKALYESLAIHHPDSINPVLVRGLALAYLALPQTVSTVEKSMFYMPIADEDSDVIERHGPVRLHKIVRDEVGFKTMDDRMKLQLETASIHDKKKYVPLIKHVSRFAFHEEPAEGGQPESMLRIYLNGNSQPVTGFDMNRPRHTSVLKMAGCMLALPDPEWAVSIEELSDDKAGQPQ